MCQAGSSFREGWGGGLNQHQLWPIFQRGDTHSKLVVLNSCVCTNCMMSVTVHSRAEPTGYSQHKSDSLSSV